MTKKQQKRYRVSFEVNQILMETIFDLLKGEDAHNFRMVELTTNGHDPLAAQSALRDPHPGDDNWALKVWPVLQGFMAALSLRDGGTRLEPFNYKDKRLGDELQRLGMSRGTASPLLSTLTRLGKLKRVKRGHYLVA